MNTSKCCETHQLYAHATVARAPRSLCAAHLLWDDGLMVLQNEPLNMMSPQLLLLQRLGLRETTNTNKHG